MGNVETVAKSTEMKSNLLCNSSPEYWKYGNKMPDYTVIALVMYLQLKICN